MGGGGPDGGAMSRRPRRFRPGDVATLSDVVAAVRERRFLYVRTADVPVTWRLQHFAWTQNMSLFTLMRLADRGMFRLAIPQLRLESVTFTLSRGPAPPDAEGREVVRAEQAAERERDDACATEIERLRAELSGQRDGEAQEIVTLRQRLAEACADAAQLRKFLADHPFPMKVDDALKRAEQAERERDETVSALRTSRALSAIAQRQRDDLRALLRECRPFVAEHVAADPRRLPHRVSDVAAGLLARLGAALGDERR